MIINMLLRLHMLKIKNILFGVNFLLTLNVQVRMLILSKLSILFASIISQRLVTTHIKILTSPKTCTNIDLLILIASIISQRLVITHIKMLASPKACAKFDSLNEESLSCIYKCFNAQRALMRMNYVLLANTF